MVKASNTSQRISCINTTRLRMVSVAKLIEDNYSIFPLPVEEFVEPGLYGTSYEITLLSQRLISNIKHNRYPS